ncbi:UvrD-helicase domain-containing protein [Arcobacter porcinus]|uniref:UvrD-helicase domain-containing protein n=1 Tax=Arcobacter porcinus TaxID=1935204 RepID=UPI00081D4889|nr:UvrD-helicase domain-containing protein [Arcobacter porcinus]OCL81640.1 ATP-dependent DNA helicase PcrA [Arcobacter porcinus]
MCLKNPSEKLLETEKQVQIDINNSIDAYEHLIFNAGAGAGKTHALIESLKHIINVHGNRLKMHNQYIICITYTNVATNEIKERLGNSELVKVSTIHERLWELIQSYQKQLVEIHKENMQALLVELRNKLYSDSIEKDYKEFRELDDENKNSFITMIKTKKSDFYTYIDKPVADLRSNFADVTTIFPNILKSKERFKKTVKLIYKIENFKECLNNINEATDKKYKSVNYLSKYNNDILHKMIISHDTLLDYAFKIIERYSTLQQIIVNKYPCILVDEYQDTHPNVVKILKTLADYAHTNQNKFSVAYFGDTAQNIYDDGVGDNINSLHPDLKRIDKIHNRRSASEIIQVINKIRNDDIEQQSIYEDSKGGSVKFYIGNTESIEDFINNYKQEWSISQNNKLHCLVLTNKLVAKYNGFENIYKKISSTDYYKKNWESINTELLSNDTSKLGNVANLFYRVLKFKHDLENPKTPLIKIIKYEIYKNLNLNNIDELLQLLKSIRGTNLQRYFISMFGIYNTTENEDYKKIIEELLNLEREFNCNGLLAYFLNELYRDIEEDKIDVAKENLVQLLTIDFSEYEKWYRFINKEENEEVIYHTYHGTKGEEYENVIIIMEKGFGKDKTKFSDFFINYSTLLAKLKKLKWSGFQVNLTLEDYQYQFNEFFKESSQKLEGEELKKFINTRNLLYVACSRAIKKLRILYLDDVSSFQGNVQAIFGETQNSQQC